jgi:hypothetical protein
MSLTLLDGKDINTDVIADGEYYVENCTGIPINQSAGYLKQTSYNDGSDVIFVAQYFRGLLHYGDRELASYERFLYPKELALEGKDAASVGWMRRIPLTYRADS